MKKKFDFTAEMNATQNPINGPENDFLEEEKRLMEKNAQGIANLNKSIDMVSDDINDLTKFLKKYDLRIKQSTIAQTEKFGDAILERFAKKNRCQMCRNGAENCQGRELHLHLSKYLLYPDCPAACLLRESNTCDFLQPFFFSINRFWKGCFARFFCFFC